MVLSRWLACFCRRRFCHWASCSGVRMALTFPASPVDRSELLVLLRRLRLVCCPQGSQPFVSLLENGLSCCRWSLVRLSS